MLVFMKNNFYAIGGKNKGRKQNNITKKEKKAKLVDRLIKTRED